MALTVVRISGNQRLAHLLRRHFTHLGDGLLVADLSARTRDEIVNLCHAETPPGRFTVAWSDPTAAQRWRVSSSADALECRDGITLKVSKR